MAKSDHQFAQSRTLLFCGASIAAVMSFGASAAYAQTAPAQAEVKTPASSATADDIVVTATRVVRDGYQAPTPTTVLGEQAIAAAAAPNIANYVNQIPSLSGSATPAAQVTYVSNGTNGINALNLRNLGQSRTLVLLDGQRVGPSTTTGWVDVNNFPQALIKRVDVVTGGASADWGSDAVAGVVNFILDKDFTGLKGEASGGLTTYGDGGNYNLSLAAGARFAGGRGHILLSLEDAHDNGVSGLPRSWYNGSKVINNPNYTPTNGQPSLLSLTNVGFSSVAPGGLITSGPLTGTYFGPGGTPLKLRYGPLVDPAGGYMQGGDWQYTDIRGHQDLLPRTERQNVFLRTSYDITDNFTIYGQFSYGKAKSRVRTYLNQWTGLTIQPDNAFIPASIASSVTGPFSLGTNNDDMGDIVAVSRRSSLRGVVGADGKFEMLGSDWTWDVYAQTSRNKSYVEANHLMNVGNWLSATDAVRNPATGVIVCRSTLSNPSNGCVPYNVFGTGVNGETALNYVEGAAFATTVIRETVEGGTLHGNPFNNWAGPISVALGVEHRRESVSGSNDPLSDQNAWLEGNFHATRGAYNVTEGFFEAVVPLAKELPFAYNLDLNGAVRVTDYSLSGTVATYKIGATYSPVPDITFRATRSRDIRAPNLSELFQAAQTVTVAITDPFKGNVVNPTSFQVTNGNLNLRPEISDTTQFGVVLRPSFIPGLQASVDYYHTKISGAISTLSGQQVINECFAGFTSLCSALSRNSAGVINAVTVQPVNFVSQVASGLDFEVSYRKDLATIAPSLKGNLSFHLLATRFIKNVYDNGITPAVDYVGGNQQTGAGDLSLPKWRYYATVGWDNDPLAIQFTARGVSAGVLNTTYIQCASSCPAQTAGQVTTNPTINNNRVAGAIYFDASFSYKLPLPFNASVFFVVNNVANTDPVQIPYGPGIFGAPISNANPMLYDTLGRTFRFGVRFKM